jgi:HJR/Mrr/RecB family endonuclease
MNMADKKNLDWERLMNERLRNSPALQATLDMLSAHPQIKDLAARIQEINSRLPRIDPAVAALLSGPIPNDLAQLMTDSLRIQSSIPTLAPEFLATLSRLQAMTDQFSASANVRAIHEAMKQNRGLLDAARRISVFAPASGKTLRDHLLGEEWPVMHSFRYKDREALVAGIDLAEIEETPAEKPSGLLIEEGHRLKRIITDIYRDNNNLLQLNSRTFEEVIAELLRSQGFTVELTKQTRDGGYDLIALSHSQGGFPLKFLVECKRYASQKIGIDVVRNLMYVVQQEQANKGIIAATTFFTRDAKEHRQAIHPYQLDLRDKFDVLEWIRQYGEDRLRLRNGNP